MNNGELSKFDNKFKEHPIKSFCLTFLIGVALFSVIYFVVYGFLHIVWFSDSVKNEALTSFVNALLTTVVALAGAVVTVVLARLGLKLGENAQRISESLHSFEYRAAARLELIPAINAIHALGDAVASFIASGRPLRFAMTRHIQIRALSEGTQTGPAHPVEFMAYGFDRKKHRDDIKEFIKKADLLKKAIDEVMRHQIAIAAIDKSGHVHQGLLASQLKEMAEERIISGGNNALDRLYLIRDYLEGNLRAMPDNDKIAWATLAAHLASRKCDLTVKNQASAFTENLAFAGWLLAFYAPDRSGATNVRYLNMGFAELMDMLSTLPTKAAVVEAASESHPSDKLYKKIVWEVANTVPLLPRESDQRITSASVARLLEVVSRDVASMVVENVGIDDLIKDFIDGPRVSGLINELLRNQKIGVDEMMSALKVENYDTWLHGAIMRYASLSPTIAWLNNEDLGRLPDEFIEDFHMFACTSGRSQSEDVKFLEALAGATLTFSATIEKRRDPDDVQAEGLVIFGRIFSTICNLAMLKRKGGLSERGLSMIMEKIHDGISGESDPNRRDVLEGLFSVASAMPDTSSS